MFTKPEIQVYINAGIKTALENQRTQVSSMTTISGINLRLWTVGNPLNQEE